MTLTHKGKIGCVSFRCAWERQDWFLTCEAKSEARDGVCVRGPQAETVSIPGSPRGLGTAGEVTIRKWRSTARPQVQNPGLGQRAVGKFCPLPCLSPCGFSLKRLCSATGTAKQEGFHSSKEHRYNESLLMEGRSARPEGDTVGALPRSLFARMYPPLLWVLDANGKGALPSTEGSSLPYRLPPPISSAGRSSQPQTEWCGAEKGQPFCLRIGPSLWGSSYQSSCRISLELVSGWYRILS